MPPGWSEAEVVAALIANQRRVNARRALANQAASGNREDVARLMLAAGVPANEVARMDGEAWHAEVRQRWLAGMNAGGPSTE